MNKMKKLKNSYGVKPTKLENLKHGDVVHFTWNDPCCNALGQAIYLSKDGQYYLCSLVEFATCCKPSYDSFKKIEKNMIFYHALDYYGNKRNVFENNYKFVK